MSIITNHAEDGKHHLAANSTNLAPSKSTQTESALESGKAPKHGFSKRVAAFKYGVPEKKLGYASAIVLRYLAYMVRTRGTLIHGKNWVRITLDHLASKFPYIGRSTVDEAILRLAAVGAC